MQWFKFYKQDYLTDTKLIGIDPLLRHIWVVLLCLTDDEGTIDYLKEFDLQKMAGCDDQVSGNPTDFDRTTGCLNFFVERKMIELQTVTNSNATVTHRVTIVNYIRRQEINLSNAERQKRYREKNKIASKTVTKERNESNVTKRYDNNARLDKIRREKYIPPKTSIKNGSYKFTDLELWELSKRLDVALPYITETYRELLEHIEDGTYKKKWSALSHKTLAIWIRRGIKKGEIPNMNEMEKMDLKYFHPDHVKKRNKEIKQLKERGIL